MRRCARGLRHRGILQGHPGGEGLRGAVDAPQAETGDGRGARPVLERLHPRHRARISEVNPRASRDLDQADLERTDRRIDVRERPTQSDLPGGSAGRHRPGQRRGLPGGADRRRAVDANCLLQPARGQRFGAAAQVFRTTNWRLTRLGSVSPCLRRRARGAPRRLRPLCERPRLPAAPRGRVYVRITIPQPL